MWHTCSIILRKRKADVEEIAAAARIDQRMRGKEGQRARVTTARIH
jgi:hypothetical protein